MNKAVNPIEAFLYFLVFIGAFFASLAFHFNYFILQNSILWLPLVSILLLISAFSLGRLLRAFWINGDRSVYYGLAIAIFLFLGTLSMERFLSRNEYLVHSKPDDFSTLRGHVGVHSGGTLLRLYQRSVSSGLQVKMSDFNLFTRFRVHHFEFLDQNKKLSCDEKESPVDCTTKWMTAFAEGGFWENWTRSYFTRRAHALWEEEKKNEPYFSFLLKDQELLAAKMSLARQLEVDDDLSEEMLMLQTNEDILDLKLTLDLFAEAKPIFMEENGTPSPNVVKLRDLSVEIANKVAKLPELENELIQMKNHVFSKK